MPSFLSALALVSLGFFLQGHVWAAENVLKFNRDIRPILSENCFHCHGPDSAKREGDLRLDVREDAIKSGAIVPGDSTKGTLLERVLHADPGELMPPAKSNRHLSDAQREMLKRWIDQGAEYETHWAFIPLKTEDGRPDVASIDEIVGQGLRERGLAFQPEASRETLIRRLTFDLTGLPPTPVEVEAFVADQTSDAYGKLVDRLLASRHYGERMAVDWLDMARYADSYGFQVDRERDVWMWRDWVIKSFNENMPYDQFATWQIAGDLLPKATDEQILATAFNRLHQQESEGGSVEEEYRVEYVNDRVQTFATAFLGLTFECARCHDHKFDPITQKEFYSLGAFFQNIDEAGLYSYFTPSVPTPTLTLSDRNAKREMRALQRKIASLEKQNVALRESKRAAFETWLRKRPETLVLPDEKGRFSFEEIGEKKQLVNAIQPDQSATLKGDNKLVSGRFGQAIEFTGDDAVDLPVGNFKRHEPFTVSLWLKTPDLKERAVIFHRSRAWHDAGSRGYELLMEEGRLKWSLIHFWPGNAISIRAKTEVPLNAWVHVTVTSDGSSRASGLKLFVNGKEARTEVVKDALTKEIIGGGGDNIVLGERFRDRGFKGGSIDEVRVFSRNVTALEAMVLYDDQSLQRINAERLWFEYFLATADEDWKAGLQELKTARGRLSELAEAQKEIMVMKELPQPKKAYLLVRGEYAQRGDEVFATTPAALPAFPKDAPRNRLGLAQWLTNAEQPLFARVTVNRFWQSLFGVGLVKTSEDFGSQSSRPLYPELLDYLSLRFMQNGWDVKALLKDIVMSETYRQRSIADTKTMADDPENEWLARGPRFRLPAEMIRDNALASAGLLHDQIGGPPVNPYEMSEAFKPVAFSKGDDVYRRSLYTSWRRTSPPPAMITFDAPRRAICSAKRERTDSPLQALVLLNGTQYVEAARVLGEKLHRDAKGNLSKMIEEGFLCCLSRKPDTRERQIMVQLYQEQFAYFKDHPQDAETFLKTGNAKRDESISAPEAVAASMLAQALLNHDASVVKR